jgi:hypothetical protein
LAAFSGFSTKLKRSIQLRGGVMSGGVKNTHIFSLLVNALSGVLTASARAQIRQDRIE